MQYFKRDETELKFVNSAGPTLDGISLDRDDLLDGAYSAAPLGDIIFEDKRSPLSNAIRQDIFRISFSEIFDAFVKVGTFEAYLTVFRKIFGDDVVVDFTVPGPGQLQIDIQAAGIELSRFVARRIEDNAYVFEPVITQDGVDNIVFQTVKGFTSQYDLEQMLFEMVPAGIYTEITLTIGE